MASQQFNNQLNQFKIKLDEDSLEYISGMLADMTLTNHDEVRESTETFLIDANINDKARNDFYRTLFSSDAFKGKASSNTTANGPVLINNNKKDSTVNEKKSEAEEEDTDKQTVAKKRITGTKRVGKRGLRGKQAAAATSEDDEPEIVAISQQSRFHTETLETSNKELDLPGVQISVNQLDLLVDAHLKLKPLTRYGLVGQNGVGKSVLMKCLADNILVGLPQNLNILHISQLEDFDENTTVVQEVLSADPKATIAIREYEALRAVIGDAAPTKKATKANQELNSVVFDIMRSRVKDRLDDATRLAIKRSGLRGREARKEQVKMEKEYSDFCKQDPQKYVTDDMVNEVIAQVFERMELVDEEERKNRAHKLLKGLGFDEKQSTSLISTFSGGWRMRIALAKSLFIKPDILLLDEPTNHLDLPAILWLQEYIINDTSDMIVVVVSHDREFLNKVTEETIILKDKQLKYHPGNYQDWEANTEEQRIRKQTMLDVSIILLSLVHDLMINLCGTEY
ncbi:hypothetical protein G6F42_015698 [Rhizopus arrhizus]|nr:hypothetical protein G6F42_015698 [Rhizopus arrhizus]